jgi:penicillin-binding protein 2
MMMIVSAAFRQTNPRLRALGVVIALGLLVLLLGLWRVQVLHHQVYGSREQAQSLRRIRLPSVRGEIVDRHGVVLADNRPSYDVVLYLEQLPRVSKRQDFLSSVATSIGAVNAALQTPVTVSERQLRAHYQYRRPLPLTLARDLSARDVAAFAERVSHLPGADLVVTPVRRYPHGALAAHVLGFVGRAEPDADSDLTRFYYYQPDATGRQGVERACDEFLRGAPGGRTIRVSPGGTLVGQVGERAAERGNRVVLTLDTRIQQIAERALAGASLPPGRDLRGAVVVLDPRSGEVLALASAPAFDPNLFNPGVPAEQISAVLNDARSPMFNRAIGARYAPGSTYKPITLLAGLQSGVVSASRDPVVVCEGALRIGNWHRPFGCWNRNGHGRVDLMTAMKQSCDVWYYVRGMAIGPEMISRVSLEFGLGRPTGIELGGEHSGLVPSPAWKRERRAEPWWDGDTAQLSIGQSFLLTTPLQMASVTATLANGGTIWRPYVVRRVQTPDGGLLLEKRPEAQGRLSAARADIELVRQTMLASVRDANGTGHRAVVRDLAVAGKTGTAEFQTAHGRIKRAWFIGFAPYDAPQAAVAVVIEDGDSGGQTAAPVAGQILAAMFGREAVGVGARSEYAD